MTPQAAVVLGKAETSVAEIVAIGQGACVNLDPDALDGLRRVQDLVAMAVHSGEPIYGLTTGVGDLYAVRLGPDEIAPAQMNILRSHASGVGAPHDRSAIRAIMATMIKALLQGFSGVGPELVITLAQMLNRGVTPWSPGGGSVGYLIATAHIGLAVFGQGKAWYRGELLPGGEALRRAGIAVREPGPREGLALIGGTYEITGIGALALERTRELVALADVAGAMTVEAVRGNVRGFDARLQNLRPQPGQIVTAARLRNLLDRSEIIEANKNHRLQDALSLRCIPQVHGAVRDALDYCGTALRIDVNSVTDNPVFIVEEGELIALSGGGNGHGAPTALALDHLAVAIAALSTMSQARSDRLTSAHLSGLTAFLADGKGANSGMMIPPYVAAALAADNRGLASPASVHTVSTCAGQEDHVSMGVAAAKKARTAADNLTDILSVEFLCAAQALDFHRPLKAGKGTEAAYRRIRASVAPRDADRDMYPDLAAVRALIDDGSLAAAVDEALRR
jgi:histidine ammonia-lyase